MKDVSYLQQFKYYQTIQKEIEELEKSKNKPKDHTLEILCQDLEFSLNAGNIRHVVYSLYKEEGLSAKEFSEKIGFTERDIINLTEKGIVNHEILNAICQYFGILKTSDLTRYI